MKTINGGVTAPKGFKASGVHCGIRKNKSKTDLALILAECDCSAAAVYTTNRVKAAPVYITQQNLKNGMARAIIANSGNANACAPNGEENAARMCRAVAEHTGISAGDVIVNSTGVIGQPLPIENIESAVPELVKELSATGGGSAAKAIMTTDTMEKEIAVSFELGGVEVKIGAIAKGSGMIHPNMATMLSFVTTDCAISPEMLQTALSRSAKATYNRISVDGDTSTNDMNAVLASGLAGNKRIAFENEDFAAFQTALDFVNLHLAKLIAKDGEGATHLIQCTVTGAADTDSAEKLSMSVISSSLTKAAMFGADANWGRVLCAMGYSGVEFDPEKVDVSFESDIGSVMVCRDGRGLPFDEEKAKEILLRKEITILCDMKTGSASANAYGCDLTYDYVKINGDYRT
ncbi:MAG: bifunctional glutamate N-acetyltransferase/amino-acid acetyltransferase ArgJ [Oscillospiraceae bacterium]|nr:bifunctional glutamate N-acetyltransferase/amino-acid acetyltransferase ArgJ [Oscillospiraceae bacterium]